MNAEVGEQGAGEPRVFATTRWSLILSAANSESGEQKARDALDELCRIYWRPIFSFVCRRGYSMEDAQDLTQDFFVKILERNWLEHADPNRGRFRSRGGTARAHRGMGNGRSGRNVSIWPVAQASCLWGNQASRLDNRQARCLCCQLKQSAQEKNCF